MSLEDHFHNYCLLTDAPKSSINDRQVAMNELISELTADRNEFSKEKFRKMVKKTLDVTGFRDSDLADELMVSVDTVRLWSEGETAPQTPVARKAFSLVILDLLNAEVNNLLCDSTAENSPNFL